MKRNKFLLYLSLLLTVGTLSSAIVNQNLEGSILIYKATPNMGIVISANGNVGIGTVSPGAALDVYGKTKINNDGVLVWGASANQGLLSWDTGQTTIGGQSGNDLALKADGYEKVRITTAGNVGIGTTAPSTKLDVAGTVSASALVVNGVVTANGFVGSGAGLTGLAVYVTTTNADARYVSWNGTVGNVSINGTISANTLVAGSGGIFGGSAGSIFVASNGNVGVGTTAPSTKLDVAGTVSASALVVNGNVGIGTMGPDSILHLYTATGPIWQTFETDDETDWAQFRYKAGATNDARITAFGDSFPDNPARANTFEISLEAGAMDFVIGKLGTEFMRIKNTGNVGIGTTAPSTKLDVAGTVSASALVVNGNVGIGTTSPQAKLHIRTGVDGNLWFRNGADVGFSNGVGLFSYNDSSNGMTALRIGGNPVVITDGNVGVGTTTPSTKLDVAGTVSASAVQVNGDIQTTSSNAFYFGDSATDGTWRIIRSGNNLVFQRRESGAWIDKSMVLP